MSDLPQPKTMEECLTMQSHFVGIPKITKNNSEEFFRRGKTLQVLGRGFWKEGQMPSLEDVQNHVDLTTDASSLDTKKWNNIIIGLLKDITTNLINYEAQASMPAEQEMVGATKNDTTDNPNDVTRRTQSDDSDDNN